MSILTAFLLVVVALSNLLCFWATAQTLRKSKDTKSRIGSIFLLFVLMADLGLAGRGVFLW